MWHLKSGSLVHVPSIEGFGHFGSLYVAFPTKKIGAASKYIDISSRNLCWLDFQNKIVICANYDRFIMGMIFEISLKSLLNLLLLLDNNENKMRQRDTDFYVETLAGENHGRTKAYHYNWEEYYITQEDKPSTC